MPGSLRELLVDLLSFVALGTVADVVPLRGENRVLTMFGLGRIKQTRFVGLNQLIDAAGLREEKIDAYRVGFVLGPRLNACGRMGHAGRAVDLFTRADEASARETAAFLTRENERRRQTQEAILDEAHQMVLEGGYDRPSCRAIVLGKAGWHPGVLGIVASRLVESFHRPVVMLNLNNGTAHGSARSVEGVSMHEALSRCAAHLDRFGGHAMAAGLTLPTPGVEALREALVEHVNARLAPEQLVRVLEVDEQVELDQCVLGLFEQIRALEPFGRGNRPPLLLIRRARLHAPARRVGGGGKHLSLLLSQGEAVTRAIAFGMGEREAEAPAGAEIDLVFEPRVSTWRRTRRAELHIKDFRPTSDVPLAP